MKVKIGVSARHIHLSQEDLEVLFGKDYQLTELKELSQKGEYACLETVTIKTDKAKINKVRILGPIRDYTQIEISKTDAYYLGLNPPVRNSGDLLGSEAITIINGEKELYKPYGCIIANRHLHINPEEAKQFGFFDKKKVRILLEGEKGGILDNVYVKMNNNYRFELHLDLDDANAHLIKDGDEGEVLINE